MSEMFSDFTKAINDLKPVRVVVVALTLCIVSALFKWVIPTGEYQSQIQTIAIIIFYLMLVLLIVLWAVYIYKQQWDKSRQLECLRNLTLDERKFLTPYIKTDESVISGSGSIPQLLRKKGIITPITLTMSTGRTQYALQDWARELLLKYPNLLDE